LILIYNYGAYQNKLISARDYRVETKEPANV